MQKPFNSTSGSETIPIATIHPLFSTTQQTKRYGLQPSKKKHSTVFNEKSPTRERPCHLQSVKFSRELCSLITQKLVEGKIRTSHPRLGLRQPLLWLGVELMSLHGSCLKLRSRRKGVIKIVVPARSRNVIQPPPELHIKSLAWTIHVISQFSYSLALLC